MLRKHNKVLASSFLMKRLILKEKPRRANKPLIIKRNKLDLIQDPLYNKGTGFSYQERDRLGLRGLVPPAYVSLNEQVKRVEIRYNSLEDPLQKYEFLSALQDRNETLFYHFCVKNIVEIAPIVYTPTIGLVCQSFSRLFKRSRGMYFSLSDKGQMNSMVYNWPQDDVRVIVVTDGSRVLGLGDLGVQGMGISIGKLSLYVAAGGIHPKHTLPICLDVGTDNKELLEYPLYVGLQRPRLTGDQYFEFVDEFIQAILYRWPNVLIQFEDFNNAVAAKLLNKYMNECLCFNDDIQGTGAVVVAGLISALKSRGSSGIEALINEKIVILGAGSAGLGVANSIAKAMMSEIGISASDAYKRFYIVDVEGLLGGDCERATSSQRSYVKSDLPDKLSLFEVIKSVKPSMLIGLSGVGGLFTEECVREMYKHNKTPIIFPLSNPTKNSECTAEQAYEWTEGNVIFASGSPFKPVDYKGVTKYPSQGNNMFIFPGLGLAASMVKARRISYRSITTAALALSECITAEERNRGQVYPNIERIREVSLHVATETAKVCFEEGVAGIEPPTNIRKYLENRMWDPKVYSDLILERGFSSK
eukprot:TRINITY_DN6312_c0_g1_i1.p1 TRINITY_DN6312_c0_g1~~TRINITY_DN6312_c0_g1_i1.p1  ORF type:complete len:588 (+),score=98.67 TRINITY_DN6312_c0_g1_i1:41-1804(+)